VPSKPYTLIYTTLGAHSNTILTTVYTHPTFQHFYTSGSWAKRSILIYTHINHPIFNIYGTLRMRDSIGQLLQFYRLFKDTDSEYLLSKF
jgi:hypothetical protein